MLQSRKPDFFDNRFFVSPILGCNVQCKFCYIYEQNFKSRISLNNFRIEDTTNFIINHPEYKPGKSGSIISIGAWGDPFPAYSSKACDYTLSWLKQIISLGNPVQIMSRYKLSTHVISEICNLPKYPNQLLFSTSITSFNDFRDIEPYADPPENRLESLSLLSTYGIPTNVMIKPYINNYTYKDIDLFIHFFKKYEIRISVVGDLLYSEHISKRLNLTANDSKTQDKQKLDCFNGHDYQVTTTENRDLFTSRIKELGVLVFKKSSCVNSYILNVHNNANYFKDRTYNYCVDCGACNKT